MNTKLAWFNYKTESYDYLDGLPETDEQAKLYIPQIDAAQRIFEIKRMMGEDIVNSMLYVLEAYVGEPHRENKTSS